MDLPHLRTFVVVAQEGSIRHAADRLCLSQPAVSAHIKALETSFGLVLFNRTARGMTLTNAGRQLVQRAEQTLLAQRDLLDEAVRLKGELIGRLRIGAGSSLGLGLITQTMVELTRRHPDVDITLQHGTSQDILQGLRNGSVDVAFYNEAQELPTKFDVIELDRFSVCLAASPDLVPKHKWSDWTALAEWPWIFPTRGSCCAILAENLFETQGFRPRRIFSVDREPIILGLIQAGAGLGLLHARTADEAQRQGDLEIVATLDPLVKVLFAHPKSRSNDPAILALQAILFENLETAVGAQPDRCQQVPKG